jgi:hypothetical protein
MPVLIAHNSLPAFKSDLVPQVFQLDLGCLQEWLGSHWTTILLNNKHQA